MAKRRNKNKKAGPVKIIRPADLNPANEPAATAADDEAAAAVAAEAVDTHAQAELSGLDMDASASDGSERESDNETAAENEVAASDEAPVYEAEAAAEAEPAVEDAVADPSRSAEDMAGAAADEAPEPVVADGSAEAADAAPERADGDGESALTAATMDADASAAVDTADASGATGSPDAPSSNAASAGSKGKKHDKKLKLNKRQKQARGSYVQPETEPVVEPTPVPEPEIQAEADAWVQAESQSEAELVAQPSEVELEAQPAVVPEIEPEVEPEVERKGPSEPRIAAFSKLAEYQTLSLAHVAGLPEEADLPGHWRGVGFGISDRRMVTAFEEVIEIIRLPLITHVPGTQPWMLGVANVRGTLLPVVDLKQFLEGERTVMHEGQRVMVVRQGGGNVAVLIDQLFGQRTFNDSQKMVTETDGDTRYGYFIKQVYRVGDNDWGVFSMSMLTRTPEFRQAAV